MTDNKNNGRTHTSYAVQGMPVSEDEYNHFIKTHHLPIRLERYFGEWSEKQDASISQEEQEQQWWRLKDWVNRLVNGFLFSVREKGKTIEITNDVKGFVIYVASTDSYLEHTFDQVVINPIMNFIRENPSLNGLIIEIGERNSPMVQYLPTHREWPMYFYYDDEED
ncbi:hypothetical protein PUF88_05150 [Lactobacillaceae bacterium L1_55_11]|nr:hypothetical protein [Lactobacillaceae bacterium L1_55_11]